MKSRFFWHIIERNGLQQLAGASLNGGVGGRLCLSSQQSFEGKWWNFATVLFCFAFGAFLIKGVKDSRVAIEGRGQGGVSASVGEKFYTCRETFYENCVLILRKITSILLYSLPVGQPSPPSGKSWRHPWKGYTIMFYDKRKRLSNGKELTAYSRRDEDPRPLCRPYRKYLIADIFVIACFIVGIVLMKI